MRHESDSESLYTVDPWWNYGQGHNLGLVRRSDCALRFGRRFALLIGNNTYRHRPLQSCHNDVKSIAAVLTNFGKSIDDLKKVCTIESFQVILVTFCSML